MRDPKPSLAAQFTRSYLIIPSIPLVILFILVLSATWITHDYLTQKITASIRDLEEEAEQQLKELGEHIIETKTEDVAAQLDLYFQMHPDMPITEMREDPEFMDLAIQKVGETGYTAVTEAHTYLFRVHPNSALNDTDMRLLKDKMPSWWKIIEGAIGGEAFKGYYDWIEPDGSIRQKFLAVSPVETPHRGKTIMVSATTYIDEFFAPLSAMQRKTDTVIENYRHYITRQWILYSSVGVFVIFLTFLSIYLMGRKAARRYITPIIKLSNAARQFGDDGFTVQESTGLLERKDEIGSLARTLKKTGFQLKSFIRDLEKRYEELKSTKDALELSERRHKMISDISSDYVYYVIFDKKGRPYIEWISGAYMEITGYTREEMNSHDVGWHAIVHPDDLVKIKKESARQQTKNDIREHEYRVVRKDGEVLWLSDRLREVFHDNGTLNYIIGAATNITSRKVAEQEVEKSLQEKETLLKELYHRTKNNMQLINAMINLQATSIENSRTRTILKELEGRIHSMALVHQKLYDSNNLSSIDLQTYISDLSSYLFSSFNITGKKIDLKLDLENMQVVIDTAVPCGLIINELLTNSIKHAFSRQETGTIGISLHRDVSGTIDLHINDNGRGLPQDLDPAASESLGFQILYAIVKHQLSGTIEYESHEGLRWHIRFREQGNKPRV